jgi:ribosomal protein S18 acetylase RimI-like enzyme
VIRKAAVENAEEILDLQKLAYQSEAAIYDDYNIPPLTQSLEEIRDDFENMVFLVAEINGKIIGSVRAFAKSGTCHIGRLIVHPDYQNQGIGTQLLSKIEEMFSKSRRFELFTGHRSEKNLYLYQKLGYNTFREETVTKELKLVYLEKWPDSER